jgi:hypothetical protein
MMDFYKAVFAVALILPAGTAGQSIVMGVNTGATRSTQSNIDPAPNRLTGRWAPTIGAFVAVPLSAALGIRFETNYVAKGYWGASYAVNLSYLEFPLLAQVTPWGEGRVRPVGVLGFARSLKLDCDVEDDQPNRPETHGVPTGEPCGGRFPKDWDTAIVLGAGAEIATTKAAVAVQIRYVRGLGSAYLEDTGPRSTNQTVYLMLGLMKAF